MKYAELSLHEEVNMQGMKLPGLIVPSSKVVDVFDEINQNWKIDGISYTKTISKEDMKKRAKKFMQTYFKLHPILYKNVLLDWEEVLLHKMKSPYLFLLIHNCVGIWLNPFRLPISYRVTQGKDCRVVRDVLIPGDVSKDYLSWMDASFRRIDLPKQVTELTVSTYVHELTHTQLINNKKAIGNYYNWEVLPYFLEMVNLYENGKQDLIDINDVENFSYVVDAINYLDDSVFNYDFYNEDDLYGCSMYLESIVKAYSLLIEYIHGPVALRKYMLKGVQDIFDGQLQLEEFLVGFGITFDSCFEDEKLLKYFCERK